MANALQQLSVNQQRMAIDIMEPAAEVGMEFKGNVNPGAFGTGVGKAITGQDMTIKQTQQISFNQ